MFLRVGRKFQWGGGWSNPQPLPLKKVFLEEVYSFSKIYKSLENKLLL